MTNHSLPAPELDSSSTDATTATPSPTDAAPELDPSSQEAHSRFLHVVEQGALVRRVGGRVRVTKGDEVKLDVPSLKLQGVVLYGNVQVTTQCLRMLLQEGAWLAICSRNGTYRGRLEGARARGGVSRHAQWRRSQEPDFCLAFAKAVVAAKIAGQRELASAYAANYLADTLGEGHRQLRDANDRVGEAADLDALRGIEGMASRAYFDLFRRWNRSDLQFAGRQQHPAVDPMNALLNLGYTLLTRELDGLLQGAGLDPIVGFYHQPDGNRPSLACDWVEEFRHIVVDRLVLKLVNKRTVNESHFVNAGTGGMRLTSDGLRAFLTAYERVMIGGTAASDDARPAGLRGVFLQQLGRLTDAIASGTAYVPHVPIG